MVSVNRYRYPFIKRWSERRGARRGKEVWSKSDFSAKLVLTELKILSKNTVLIPQFSGVAQSVERSAVNR